jgi:hypothetical protein
MNTTLAISNGFHFSGKKALILLTIFLTLFFMNFSASANTRINPSPITKSVSTFSNEVVSTNLPIVGQFGGESKAIAVHGGLAFLGIGPKVVQLDVSDPSQPGLISQTSLLPGVVVAIAIDYPNLYVVDSQAYLTMLTIDNDSEMRIINQFRLPGYEDVDYYRITDLVIKDEVAYITKWVYQHNSLSSTAYLFIVNVQNPDTPLVESVYSANENRFFGMYLENDIAYIAAIGQLLIIDVSDTGSPFLIGSSSIPVDLNGSYGVGKDVYVLNNLAYVAYDNNVQGGALVILDVGDLLNVEQVGLYMGDLSAEGDLGMETYAITVVDHIAILTCGERGSAEFLSGLAFVDISDPAQPNLISTYQTNDAPYGFFMQDNLIFVAATSAGLEIIDATTIDTPVEVGLYDQGAGGATNLYVNDGIAYVASEEKGMQIIDVSIPNSPEAVSVVSLPGSVWGVDVSDSMAYVTFSNNPGQNGFQVFDISNLRNPILLGNYDDGGLMAWDIDVAGGYAYLNTTYSLQIVDITDPSQIHMTGYCCGTGPLGTVQYDDGLVYKINEFAGFQIIDVRNPSTPTQLYNLLECELLDFVVDNNIAYITNGNYGLQILDIAEPAQTNIIGNLSIPGASSIAKMDNTVFVVSDLLLYRIDAHDPTQPKLLNTYNLPSTVRRIRIFGESMFMASQEGGIYIFDIPKTEVLFLPYVKLGQ